MTEGSHTAKRTQQPVVDRLLSSREALLASAAPGLAAAHALCVLADEAVTALARKAEPGARWAVVALGGYGCGRLLPASDFDLLIVSDAPASRVRDATEAVFYPLWDSGLPVGHQVRTRKQHVKATAEDLSTLTASLTGRVVAGDREFGETLLREVALRARKARRRLTPLLAARARPGSPFLLQPDLKAGAGGQRDLDELTWTAAVLSGEVQRDHRALLDVGVLEPAESGRADAAAEALAAARWGLHLLGQRRKDLLTPEAAEELPLDLESLTAAMADASAALLSGRRRVAGVAPPAPIAEAGTLLDALREGMTALPRLEEAAWAGELEELVPGLRTLMPLRRPGLSHTRTLGAHCLAAAASVADCGTRDRLAGEVLAALPDRRPLLAAALAHDAGKRLPGPGHAERGVAEARAVAERIGVPASADETAVLVREHLTLAETAARDDVADEDAVLRAAARIGRRELIGPLYVLTVADTLATREDMWTPWRAALIGDLVSRLDAALAPEVEGAGVAEAAETTRRAALALLSASDPDARSFVEVAPLRYLATTPPGDVATHAALAAPLVGLGDPAASAVGVGAGPAEGTWRLIVAASDRPGLFAMLAGVVALAGLSILAADALAGPRGIVLDVFTVEGATGADVDTSTWTRFERLLGAALAGHLDVGTRLTERRRHYPPARPELSVRLAEVSRGSFATSVRVEAGDAVGLLHDLAHAFADAGLDIRSATVLTLDAVASDTFRVVDASGEPPSAEEVVAALAPRLGTTGDGTRARAT